jgi:hypothetical protein
MESENMSRRLTDEKDGGERNKGKEESCALGRRMGEEWKPGKSKERWGRGVRAHAALYCEERAARCDSCAGIRPAGGPRHSGGIDARLVYPTQKIQGEIPIRTRTAYTSERIHPTSK